MSREHDHWDGYDYHVTVHGRGWWLGAMAMLGYHPDPDVYAHFDPDWVRGPANGMNSFPLVLRDAGRAAFG